MQTILDVTKSSFTIEDMRDLLTAHDAMEELVRSGEAIYGVKTDYSGGIISKLLTIETIIARHSVFVTDTDDADQNGEVLDVLYNQELSIGDKAHKLMGISA